MGALVLETLLGFLTFTGSLIAFGKLQELLPTRPLTYKDQNVVNLSLFAVGRRHRRAADRRARDTVARSRSSPASRWSSA